LRLIGDDEHGGFQFEFALIDGGDLFAWFSAADDDFSSLKALIVEAVERLADFHHDVIGDIDDVANCPNSNGFQTSRHPVRAGCDGELIDDACGVAGAEVRGIVSYAGPKVYIFSGFVERDGWKAELGARGGGDFACDANVSQAGGAVGSDFDVKDEIGAGRLDAFDGKALVGKDLRNLLGGFFEGDVVPQPLE